jgi:uncharacterized phage-associated protein
MIERGDFIMLDLRKYQYFDYEKTIQLLGYIQRKSNSTDKLTLIKLLFFADRVHLRRHFSLISHDVYYALQNGPAASKTVNVLNRSVQFESKISNKNKEFLAKIEKTNRNNRTINETQTDCLSKYEMEAVDMVVDLFGKFSTKELVEITHDYPEWKRWKEFFAEEITEGELVVIDDFFKNPDIKDSPALQKYFNGTDPLYEEEDYLEEVKAFYNTRESLRNAYN